MLFTPIFAVLFSSAAVLASPALAVAQPSGTLTGTIITHAGTTTIEGSLSGFAGPATGTIGGVIVVAPTSLSLTGSATGNVAGLTGFINGGVDVAAPTGVLSGCLGYAWRGKPTSYCKTAPIAAAVTAKP